jgi:heme oxygenase
MRLSQLLKHGTESAHKEAENNAFIREFIKCNISLDNYRQFTADLLHVYGVLEHELDKHSYHPSLEALYFPEELRRAQALSADALFFDAVSLPPSCAALAYCSRLHEIGTNCPELLLAHAYTRYMGDLSGGRVLKRCLTKALKLSDDGKGAQFYEFPRIKDIKQFKDMYRARLDTIELSEAQEVQLVEEARSAFALNMHMFQELDPFAGSMPRGDAASPNDVPVEDTASFFAKPYTAEDLVNTAMEFVSPLEGKSPLKKHDGQAVCPFATLVGSASDSAAACQKSQCPFAALVGSASPPHGHANHSRRASKHIRFDSEPEELMRQKSDCPLARLGRTFPTLAMVALPVAVCMASKLLAR